MPHFTTQNESRALRKEGWISTVNGLVWPTKHGDSLEIGERDGVFTVYRGVDRYNYGSLSEALQCARKLVRDSPSLSRFGSEEIACIVWGVGLEKAKELYSRDEAIPLHSALGVPKDQAKKLQGYRDQGLLPKLEV